MLGVKYRGGPVVCCHGNRISRESCANLTLSLGVCALKKPPDLHARCCYDNKVDQFVQFLFSKLAPHLLPIRLRLARPSLLIS